ncbi:MAG: sodium-dependent transporter [Ruminococcaceae bacterium]|nr:sodium-dependent transporter [Oscillospiraceae bacterium]
MARDRLGSRLGFILLSAGCAIGIGNVWKFPWMVGQYGGAIFVLIYIACLIVLGIPVMTMEFAVGRAAQKSPSLMFQQLEKKGSKWHWHGIVCLMGCVLLMMFYTNVSGWMMQYFVKTASGTFEGLGTAGVNAEFNAMLGDATWQTIFMAITVIIGIVVCMLGVQKGLERVTKVMMVALLVLMVVIAGNSIFLEGGSEGLKFYLIPNVESVKKTGIFNVIVAAMNQAFFTLSLGIGSMAIFGSYLGKDRALLGEAVNVAVLDTFVAFTSGLIIFPACFAYGINPGAGPALIFQTLPSVFNHMPLGRLWGTLFFVFMSFAALSTVLAVFENIIACVMDLTKWGRKKTCIIVGIGMFLLSMPCVLGYNLLSDFKPFGGSSSILDLEDFIVSNLLLPIGALIFTLFCVTRYGWGWKNFIAEANTGKGLKVRPWMRWVMTIVVPIIIAIIFVMGLVTFNFTGK